MKLERWFRVELEFCYENTLKVEENRCLLKVGFVTGLILLS